MVDRAQQKYAGTRVTPNGIVFKSLAQYYNSLTQSYSGASSQMGHWKQETVGNGFHRARMSQASLQNNLPSAGAGKTSVPF